MPAEFEHKAAYDRHLKSYEDTVDKHPDWAAVMLFYCAVHQVERLFALDSFHSCEHGDREYKIKTKYASLWGNYRSLKSESLKTRYLQGGLFTMSVDRVKTQLRGQRLAAIVSDIGARVDARTMIPPA